MLKFADNLSMMYTEHAFLDRYAAAAADGTVKGSFYNSDIQAGRWKQARGRLCASFRTTDGKGPYHTSVCLAGNEAVGQTWAEHRNFLFNWNAVRAAR